jgi:hypothetical protein
VEPEPLSFRDKLLTGCVRHLRNKSVREIEIEQSHPHQSAILIMISYRLILLFGAITIIAWLIVAYSG